MFVVYGWILLFSPFPLCLDFYLKCLSHVIIVETAFLQIITIPATKLNTFLIIFSVKNTLKT